MASNRKRKQVNRLQIVIFILLLGLVGLGLNYYYAEKEKGIYQIAQFTSSDQSLKLEVADTPEERSLGLMYRKDLASDHGMLFKYEQEEIQSFWMKNTYIPLDMIFMDSDYKIVGIIKEAKPLSSESLRIKDPSIYVVELNAGMADKLKLKVGERLLLK